MKTVRFGFGNNWLDYSSDLTEEQHNNASLSLIRLLDRDSLKGLRFLDIGSGSGIFSLAAYRLGADVTSFDYDINSVRATTRLRLNVGASEKLWSVFQGDILDISETGMMDVDPDIIYAWGVLHHTGNLHLGLNNTIKLARKSGCMVIVAIYNYQPVLSDIWKLVKRMYNMNSFCKYALTAILLPYFVFKQVVLNLVKLRHPFHMISKRERGRGMSFYHDVIDWVGGYPFETMSASEVVETFTSSGFRLKKARVVHSHGCNEFVFERV